MKSPDESIVGTLVPLEENTDEWLCPMASSHAAKALSLGRVAVASCLEQQY